MRVIPKIDPEFKSLIPPLSEDEFKQLEQNIVSGNKCRDAIVLWKGIIADGHNRYQICEKHVIEYETTDLRLSSREEVKLCA